MRSHAQYQMRFDRRFGAGLHAVRRALTLPVFGALLAGGCSSSTEPDRAPVTADATSREMLVHNGRRLPIFTFAVGRQAAAVVDWYPCVDATRCPPIASGGRRTTTIHGNGQRETEALLYWWHARPRGDGTLVADSIRVIVVPLP